MCADLQVVKPLRTEDAWLRMLMAGHVGPGVIDAGAK